MEKENSIATTRALAGYILAGGKNSRMGGRKKLFLTYQGKQFYDWMREGLSLLDKVYVSVEQEDLYDAVKEELVVDQYGDAGPAGAILSGLHACREKALLVIPCDMIPFPAKLTAYILQVYEEEGLPLVIRKGGRLAMFPGIYTEQMIPLMERRISIGQYRVGHIWQDMRGHYTIIDADDFAISNINTTEQYVRLPE